MQRSRGRAVQGAEPVTEAEKLILSTVAKEGPEVLVAVAHLLRDLLAGESAETVQARAERVAVLKGFRVAVSVAADAKRSELQAKGGKK